MSLSPQEFSHHEDMDFEAFSVDEFPWDESWGESTSLFESLEPLIMLKSMPSREELLAIDTLNTPMPEEAEFEDFALDE